MELEVKSSYLLVRLRYNYVLILDQTSRQELITTNSSVSTITKLIYCRSHTRVSRNKVLPTSLIRM